MIQVLTGSDALRHLGTLPAKDLQAADPVGANADAGDCAVRRCCSHTAWAFSACMVYELWKGQEQCNNAVPKLRRNIRTASHQQHTAFIHSAIGSSGHHTLKALYKRRKRESSTFCLYISHSPVCTHAHTHTHTFPSCEVCVYESGSPDCCNNNSMPI